MQVVTASGASLDDQPDNRPLSDHDVCSPSFLVQSRVEYGNMPGMKMSCNHTTTMNKIIISLVMVVLFGSILFAEDFRDKIGIYVTPHDENDPRFVVSYTQALETLKGHARVVWALERWRRIETKEGEFDWSSLDRRVNKATELGFEVGLRLQLVLCGNDARKQHVAAIQTPAYIGDTMDTDAFRTAVVRFYGTAAQRYKGKVKYISVGNSVNKYFEENPKDWAGFKKIYPKIVDAIHAADPKIVVMSDLASGGEFFADEARMSKYTDFFRDSNDDAAGYLFYYIAGVYYGKDFKNFGPESMMAALENLHRWAGKKRIYIIETSCFSTHPKTGKDMSDTQSRFVEMLLKAVQEKDWILGVSWWLFYDAKDLPDVAWDMKATFGLFSADGTPKPAWETWKRMAGSARPAVIPKHNANQ
jgi:hypothetical protein